MTLEKQLQQSPKLQLPQLLSQIDRLKDKLDQYKPFSPKILEYIEEYLSLNLTYNSNAIEGNTLSFQETKLIVTENLVDVKGKELREIFEAINHQKANQFIQKLAKEKTTQEITQTDILDIHKTILTNIQDGGHYRSERVFIRGSKHIPPNPLKVADLMSDFITWLQTATDHPVKIAAMSHFKLASIHPFTDGNGRTSRVLMNLIFLQHGYPLVIIKKEDRLEYIHSLENENVKDDLSFFELLIAKSLKESMEYVLKVVEDKE